MDLGSLLEIHVIVSFEVPGQLFTALVAIMEEPTNREVEKWRPARGLDVIAALSDEVKVG